MTEKKVTQLSFSANMYSSSVRKEIYGIQHLSYIST